LLVTNKIKNGPYVVPVWIALWYILFICLDNFFIDYITSLEGYKLLETRQIVEATNAPAWYGTVAVISFYGIPGLLQALQMVMFYIYATDTRQNRWALMVGGGAMVLDSVLDWTFRSGGGDWFIWAQGLGQTILIFTIGSEVGISFAFGLIVDLTDDAMQEGLAWAYLMVYYIAKTFGFVKDLFLSIFYALTGQHNDLEKLRHKSKAIRDERGGRKPQAGRKRNSNKKSQPHTRSRYSLPNNEDLLTQRTQYTEIPDSIFDEDYFE